MSNQSNSSNSKPEVLVVCGPTATGKTALAIKLAGDKPTSIISADSRQIYRGLDIVTGKDIPEGFNPKDGFHEKDNLRLWGMDLLSPDGVYNAGEFARKTRQIIDKDLAEGRTVFVVGGTGFYLKALVHPETISTVVPNEELRQKLELLSLEELIQKLIEINPSRYRSMNQSDAANPRRLIRAIEIAHPSDESHQSHVSHSSSMTYSFSWLGLKTSLDDLKLRIESRVRDRLASGAIDEVRELIKKFPNQSLPVYTTLGVKPIIKYLSGEIDRPKLEQIWVTDELNYAKRQITWFKKQPGIQWHSQH